MQIVCSEGQLTLEPIPGDREGTVSGYALKCKDEATGLELVVMMAPEFCAKLGAVMVKHTEENPAAPAPIALAPASMATSLKKLPADHRPRRPR